MSLVKVAEVGSIFDNQIITTITLGASFSAFQRKESAPMEFISSKRRAISASLLLAALVPAVATIYLLLKHVPHGTLYWIQLSGIVGLTILALSFPACWVLFPHRHPVHRALAVHGDATALASQLNAEMRRGPEVQRPFCFTSSFLTYSPGYTLDVVPYESILSALKEMSDSGEGPAVPVVVVHTKQGRTYKWYRTWMQGMFDADQVLLSLRRRANLTQKIGDVYYRTSAGDSDKSKTW
jgi:hypothetical protein